ncbi:MAG: protein kinase [Pirellulales bacterium]
MSADEPGKNDEAQVEADLESALWDYAFDPDNSKFRLALKNLEQAGADWQTARHVVDMLSVARHWGSAAVSGPVEDIPLGQSGDDGYKSSAFPIYLGRYKLLREIGSGGSGVVYAAFDEMLCRDVAVKVPLISHQLNEEARHRFIREGRAAARLSHPNVVRLHEVAQMGTITFIVSDFYAGTDLATWLLNRQDWPTCQEAAAFIAELADGVFHAHEQGVLHRDIKPANILLTLRADGSQVAQPESGSAEPAYDDVLSASLSRCRPVLTDFGLAKLCEKDEGITRSGTMMGTPAYMAPEQFSMSRQTVSQTADIYSLGAVLYELITGRALFSGPSVADVLRQVANEDPVRCRKYQPNCPPDLESICIRCLSKSPNHRYASARQLADDLRRFLNGEVTLARPIGPIQALVRWGLRHRPFAALLLALLVTSTVLVITSAWYVLNLRRINGELNTGIVREHELLQQVARQEQISRTEAERNSQFAYAAAVRDGFRLYQSGDTIGLTTLLNAHPLIRETSSERFEIGLLRSVSMGGWHTLGVHSAQIFALAFDPNGSRLFAGHKHGHITVWNIKDRAFVRELAPLPNGVGCLTIAPGGSPLIAAVTPTHTPTRGHWYVWDDQGGVTWGPLPLSGKGADPEAAISPTGKQLAISSLLDTGMSVDVYAMPMEQNPHPIHSSSIAHANHIHGVAWSRNGERLAVAWGVQPDPRDKWTNHITVWQTADWSTIMELPLPPSTAYGLVVPGPASDNFAVCNGAEYFAVVDPDSAGQIEGIVPNSTLRTLFVGDQSDCIYFGGVYSVNDLQMDSIDCLDLATLKLRHRQLNPYNSSGAQKFDSRGAKFARAEFDHHIRVRDLGARGGMWLVQPHQIEAWGLAWSPDGSMLASTSDDGSIGLTDVREMRVTRQLIGHAALVSCAAFSPDGKTLYSGSYDGTIRSWNLATGTNQVMMKDLEIVRAIAVDRTGHWCAFAGNDNTCKVVDLTPQDHLGDVPILGEWRLGDTVRGMAFSPDGSKVVSTDENRTLVVHDWRSGDTSVNCPTSNSLNAVAVSNDGQSIYVGDSSGLVQRFGAPFDSRSTFAIVGKHLGEVLGLSVSPDDRLIATGGPDQTVRIWDAATFTECACWNLPSRVNAVSWSPDGRCLAAALHDGSVIIWSTD